ncbi:MAG: acyl carrier protein [Clostridia bacterium]|nr:acyl carrier protein [Clostridia bacterium]
MFYRKVLKVFEDMFDIRKDDIEPESTLEEIGIDDIAVVDLALALEEEFDLDIPEDIYGAWTTVGDIVNYVENEAY